MQSLVGQDVGRYHIIEQLGEGGMATVYKAHDNRLERYVAIKVIRSDQVKDSAFLRRFEREAKALAQLSHTNIVKVLDYGDHQGEPYVVMEYLPGGTLKQKLGKPLDYREASKMLAPIARALEYAHRHKIIHRDVKPANILLSESDQPMLSDFGIAKMLEVEGMTQLTSTGVGIGTPEYMAPEQGFGRAIDQRADVYALGVVFYELVTGRRPFRADTPLAVLMKHMTDPLPSPRSFLPSLPDAVEKVIFKAMAKKPEERYQDMGAFAAALEALAVGQGLPQQDETVIGLAHAPGAALAKKKGWLLPLGIAGGVVIAVLVCLGLGALGVFGYGRDLFGIGKGTPEIDATQAAEKGTSIPATQPGGGSVVSVRQQAQWGSGMVLQAAYMPGGSQIVMATTLGLDMLDAATLEHLDTYLSGIYINSIAISADGKWIAALASGGSLSLLDGSTGEILQTFEGYEGSAGNLAFSPDGKWLACASSGGLIRLWQSSDWSIARELDMQTAGLSLYDLTVISFSPDSSLLVGASGGGVIRVYDVASGSQVWMQQAQAFAGEAFLGAMTVSPDGRWMAAAVTSQLMIWSLSDGTPVDVPMEVMMNVSNMVFSPDGKTLALTGYTGGVRLLNTADWTTTGNINTSLSLEGNLHFSPDGSNLFIPGGFSRSVMERWALPQGTLAASAERYNSMLSSLALSQDGELVGAAYYDASVRIYRAADGSILQSVLASTSYGGQPFLFLSPDGERMTLVSSSEVKTIALSDGAVLESQELKGSAISAALSADRQYLALGAFNGTVQVYRMDNGSLLGTLEGHGGAVQGLAFSPDGSLLATASKDSTIRLWRSGDWTLQRTLTGHAGAVNGVVFSPDGSLLVSASDDQTAIVWRVMDGAVMQTMKGHADKVLCAVFSADGARVATGSVDGTIRLWDAEKATMLLALEGHTAGVKALAFSPQGGLLVSASLDGTMRLWDADR